MLDVAKSINHFLSVLCALEFSRVNEILSLSSKRKMQPRGSSTKSIEQNSLGSRN